MKLRRPARRAVPILLAAASWARFAWAGEITATVTDSAGAPLRDAVVFVYDIPGRSFSPPDKPYVMDQLDKEFVPHLLPIMVGGRVRFPNKDNIYHHIYSFSPAKTFDLPLYKGEPAAPVTFPKAGIAKLGCNIHDWMSGIVLVLPTPYFAPSDSEGRARLDVPESSDAVLAVFYEFMKGSVDDTRKKIPPAERGPITWSLPTKPRPPDRKPAMGYK